MTPTSAVVTTSAPTAIFTVNGSSLTATEQVEFDVTSPATLGSTVQISTPLSITVVATLYPLGDGVTTSDTTKLNAPREDQGYPTFLQADTSPVTIANVVSANTTLLIPLAEKSGTFDTGIAIANTTADPFGTSGGGATPGTGTVKFDFFGSNVNGTSGAGTACTLTTSSTNVPSPRVGINADGTVPAAERSSCC